MMAQPAEQRLQRLEASKEIVFQRDDLTVELLSLWNGLGRYDDAAAVLRERCSIRGKAVKVKPPGNICLINYIVRWLPFSPATRKPLLRNCNRRCTIRKTSEAVCRANG